MVTDNQLKKKKKKRICTRYSSYCDDIYWSQKDITALHGTGVLLHSMTLCKYIYMQAHKHICWNFIRRRHPKKGLFYCLLSLGKIAKSREAQTEGHQTWDLLELKCAGELKP